MRETSKSRPWRESANYGRFFYGRGIDIGAGDDPLVWPNTEVAAWDVVDGDAQYMMSVADDSYDFVYSSHCLEHMVDPAVAMQNWIRICRPGGYVVISVPHEVWYEKNKWPSQFNADHKWSFRNGGTTIMPKSIDLRQFVQQFPGVIAVSVRTVLVNFDLDAFHQDQTLGKAICQIDVVLQKIA